MAAPLRALARAIISAFLVAAFVPMSAVPAGAQVGAAGLGTDGVISVTEQVTYTDSLGRHWIDGTVVNSSATTLTSPAVPVTFVASGVPVPDVVEKTYADAYALTPGQAATFHHELYSLPETWTPVAGSGGGWATDFAPLPLEVVDSGPIALVTALGGDWEALGRTYSVVVRNPNAVPVGSLIVAGSERQGLDTSSSALLDTLASDRWSGQQVAAGATATVEVKSIAPEDADASTTVSAAFAGQALEQPRITLWVNQAAPDYGDLFFWKITLRRADGTVITGDRTLKIWWSNDGQNWTYKHLPITTGVATGSFHSIQRLYLKAAFYSDGRYAYCESPITMVQPTSVVTEPDVDPVAVSPGEVFTAGGLVKPDVGASLHDVRIQCFRKERQADGTYRWVLRKTVLSTTSAYPGICARYSARLSISYRGTWAIRAFNPADARTRADVSSFDYLTVR